MGLVITDGADGSSPKDVNQKDSEGHPVRVNAFPAAGRYNADAILTGGVSQCALPVWTT